MVYNASRDDALICPAVNKTNSPRPGGARRTRRRVLKSPMRNHANSFFFFFFINKATSLRMKKFNWSFSGERGRRRVLCCVGLALFSLHYFFFHARAPFFHPTRSESRVRCVRLRAHRWASEPANLLLLLHTHPCRVSTRADRKQLDAVQPWLLCKFYSANVVNHECMAALSSRLCGFTST